MIAKSILSAIALTLSLASASSIASDVGFPGGLCFEIERGVVVRVDCSKPNAWFSPKDSGHRMSESQLEKLIAEIGGKHNSSVPDLGVDKPFDPKDLSLLRNDFYKPYGTKPTFVR